MLLLSSISGGDDEDDFRDLQPCSDRSSGTPIIPSALGRRRSGAYFAFLNLLTLGIDRSELKGRADLDAKVREHQYLIIRLTEADTVGVQRNDPNPCPCGSGKKFKKRHEDQVKAD